MKRIIVVLVLLVLPACAAQPSPDDLRTQATIVAAQGDGMVRQAADIERRQSEARRTAAAFDATRNAPTATPLPPPTAIPQPICRAGGMGGAMIDFTEKLKHGRLAALHVGFWGIVLSGVIALCIGLFFAESNDPMLRRAHWIAAALGIVITFSIVISIITNDIAQHHYRENMRAEKEAERVEAEIEEINARRALYAAKERAIYTPLPGRVAPSLPEPSAPAMYVNGERIDAQPAREEMTTRVETDYDDRDEQDERDETPTPRGIGASRERSVINESADAYALRIRQLANAIYRLCRDVNPPTQDAIKERIPLTAGGLLRSNDDITRALNLLAAQRLIEPEKGQGITRFWLMSNGEPAPRTRKRSISANVPVQRG